MPIAHVNDIDIAYDDVGEGEVVVLVHGHPFDRTMWSPQVDAIVGSGRRVITPDCRGYGHSQVVAGVTTLSEFAADVLALLDVLAVGRATFVGLSMGGQIVMELCVRAPERVMGVVLADTSPDVDHRAHRANRMRAADELVRRGMTGYVDDTIDRMLGPTTMASRPDVVAHVRSMMLATPPAGAAAALRGRALRREYVSTLEQLEAPALVVVGSDDSFVSLADAQRLHGLMPHSRLAVIGDAGHLPNLERPDAFNAALVEFLADATSGVHPSGPAVDGLDSW